MSAKGKYAEGKVKAVLEVRKQAVAAFTYNRIADAHSARGAMSNPQPGDFQWFENTGQKLPRRRRGKTSDSLVAQGLARLGAKVDDVWVNDEVTYTRNGLIEVKEVEHDCRLPYKNFAIDQVGRMKIRQMAGSECIVIVCHRSPVERKPWWRQVPLDFLSERDASTPFGSWDLSHFPATQNLEEIFNDYFK